MPHKQGFVGKFDFVVGVGWVECGSDHAAFAAVVVVVAAAGLLVVSHGNVDEGVDNRLAVFVDLSLLLLNWLLLLDVVTVVVGFAAAAAGFAAAAMYRYRLLIFSKSHSLPVSCIVCSKWRICHCLILVAAAVVGC